MELIIDVRLVVLVLLIIGCLMGLCYIGGKTSGRKAAIMTINARHAEIDAWMNALCRVKLNKPFEGLGLRDEDLRDLRSVAGHYGDDAWAHDIASLVNKKLLTYEGLKAEILHLLQLL